MSILLSSASRALTMKCPRTKSKMKSNKMTHLSLKYVICLIATMGQRKNWESKGLRFDTLWRLRWSNKNDWTKMSSLFPHEPKSYYLSMIVSYYIYLLMIHNQWNNLCMKRVCRSGFLQKSFQVLVPRNYNCTDVRKPSDYSTDKVGETSTW